MPSRLPSGTAARPHRVAVLVFDHPAVFELSVPCEVWGIDRRDMGVPPSEVRICTADPVPLQTDMGFTIHTTHGLEALRWADTVVVPSAPKPFGVRPIPAAVVEALRAAHRRGARLASVCSGAFTLAATGLLDGRVATCHWMHAGTFRATYPEVLLDERVLYTGADNLWVSAGTAAGIDLCLHLVRMDWGADVANTIARRMVVPPHRDGGQAQFVEHPVPRLRTADDDLSATLAWAAAHLDREMTVEDLAHRAHMASRTFARRFRQATGTTPLQWFLHQRVVTAQRMLETTDLPVELVARRCGLGAAANLRMHFARIVGTSPRAYRETFRRAG